jgi:hypothetical protein
MKPHKLLLWLARICGLLVTAFFLVFYIGEGIPDIIHGKGKELLQFLPFTLITVTGFIVAWFKPFTGGILLMAGSVLMGVYFIYIDDIEMAVIYGLPSLLIGLCFIAAADKELI